MQITDVRAYLYEVPAADPPFRWRNGLPGSDPASVHALLRISTDLGVDGCAIAQHGKIFSDILKRRLKTELLGQDPLRREYLWKRLWEVDRIEEFPLYILGTVDTALWDLAAKYAGLPLHAFLGGYRNRIPSYASTVTYPSIEEYIDVANQCLSLGYTAIKVHAWGEVRKDAALCLALRKHVGSEVNLMYDGSGGFDLPDAVYLGKVLEEAGYFWYEEPMREHNIYSYQRLAESTRVPLLVGETSDGAHYNTADFISQVNCGFVRTGCDYRAGVTGALRTAHLAESFQIRAEVHGGGLANTHLCMTIPNTTYFESLVWGNPIHRDDPVEPDGYIYAPVTLGIFGDMDFDEIEQRGRLVPFSETKK